MSKELNRDELIDAVMTKIENAKPTSLELNSDLLSKGEIDVFLAFAKEKNIPVNINSPNTDPLTGLKNADRFKQDFDAVLKDADSELFDVTVVITDIDEFMKVNDNFGHEKGDDVIRKSAEILKNLGCEKEVYRYSGDSFAVICAKAEKETVFLLMEEARKTFAEDALCREVSVTMCAGIATYPEDGANEAEILRKADGALYRAKSTGRNKIALAKEEKLVTKTAHYTVEQLKRLKDLSEESGIGEAALMREALDEIFKKYDRKKTIPQTVEKSLLKSAVEIAIEHGTISSSMLQQKCSIGYGKAQTVIQAMVNMNWIEEGEFGTRRTVLITQSEYEDMLAKGMFNE